MAELGNIFSGPVLNNLIFPLIAMEMGHDLISKKLYMAELVRNYSILYRSAYCWVDQ